MHIKSLYKSKPSLSLFIATFIVSILFFDVIFLSASLQPSNLALHLERPAQYDTVDWLPTHHNQTRPTHGYSDLGSTAWQSEPTRHFTANTLRNGDSIFWNPWSASGSLGPETLVDLKVSPLTLIEGLFFNASAASFDFGLMLLFILSSAALLYLGTVYLRMKYLAAAMMIFAFLLSGYATANFSSQNAQAYFLAPIALLSLFNFYHKPTAIRWFFSLCAQATLLLITMLPVTLVVLITIHALALLWAFDESQHQLRSIVKLGIIQFFSPIFAIFLIAPVWFPILDYLTSGTLVDSYSRRTPQHYSTDNLLNIFSPRHFWENYNGIRPTEALKASGVEDGRSIIPHLGIVTLFIAIAMPITRRHIAVTIGCILMITVGYGRQFGLPPFTWVEFTPVLSIVGKQYWGAMTCLSFAIFLGLAFKQLQEQKHPSLFKLALVTTSFCIAFFILFNKLGWPQDTPYKGYVFFSITLAILSALALISLKLLKNKAYLTVTIILAIISIGELFFYINHLRPVRHDFYANPPEFVQYLQDNVDDKRVFSIGNHNALVPEYGSMYKIRQISTMSSSVLPWYENFYRRSFGNDWPNRFLALGPGVFRKQRPNQPAEGDELLNELALDFLGVKYIVVPRPAKSYRQFFYTRGYPLDWNNHSTFIFQNTDPLPNAFMRWDLQKGEKAPVASKEQLLTVVFTNDNKLLKKKELLSKTVAIKSSITRTSFSNSAITYSAQTDKAGVMVTNEIWHSNWSATINGESTPVYRVNGAFRGIWLPKGQHEVMFSYRPRSLTLGIIASLLTLLFCVFLMIRQKIRTQ